MDLEKIIQKHYKIINISKDYMNSILDAKHNLSHIKDVFENVTKILQLNTYNADIDCVVISIFWHDVGRIKVNKGHEKVSAEMLKEQLLKHGYSIEFAKKCYDAIIFHNWQDAPISIEGKILRDADKLAFLGLNRWEQCLNNNIDMQDIIDLLPILKPKLLMLEESKILYDSVLVNFIKFIYEYLKQNKNND